MLISRAGRRILSQLLSGVAVAQTAGGLTGAALNPARAFGPAVVAWTFHSQAVYWIGPAIGGALAGWVWKLFLLPAKG